MTKMMFPELDPSVVKRVNRSIDTPQAWMPQNTENSVGRVPGMNYAGHRKYGHDMVTAGMLGYFRGGPQTAVS